DGARYAGCGRPGDSLVSGEVSQRTRLSDPGARGIAGEEFAGAGDRAVRAEFQTAVVRADGVAVFRASEADEFAAGLLGSHAGRDRGEPDGSGERGEAVLLLAAAKQSRRGGARAGGIPATQRDKEIALDVGGVADAGAIVRVDSRLRRSRSEL